MPIKPILLKGHTRNLTQIMFNKDSDLLFTCAKDITPMVWYSKNGERLGTFEGHEGAVFCCDVTYDSKRLITGSGDMSARLWDVYTGKQLYRFDHNAVVRSVAFSVGDEMVAVTCNKTGKSASCVYIYGLDENVNDIDPEPLRTLKNPGKGNFIKVMWGALNAYIITIDEDGFIRKWDFDEESIICENKLSKQALSDLSFSKDRAMALVTSRDMIGRLVDLEDEELKVIKTYKSDRPLNSGAISPNMNHVILAGGQDANDVTLSGSDEGHFEIDFWHIYYEERLASVKGHFGPVNTVAISPDGKMFASAGEDGFVRLHHFDDTYLNSSY